MLSPVRSPPGRNSVPFVSQYQHGILADRRVSKFAIFTCNTVPLASLELEKKIGTDGTARVRHARRPSSAAASAQTSRSRATRGVTRRESKNSDKPFTAVNERKASTRDQHSQRVEVAMRR